MPGDAVACVIDTSVLVAGLITIDADSPTVKVVDGMLSGSVLYLLSRALLQAYADVLVRPKLRQLHALDDQEMDTLLMELVGNAVWREPEVAGSAPDGGDDHLWVLLSTQSHSILVTGDTLLIDNPPATHSVLSPRSFSDLFLGG